VKRTLIGAAVLALGLSGVASSFAGDDNPGARKAQLVAAQAGTLTSQCESTEGDVTTGDVSGFVIINAPGQPDLAQKVNGEVSLKQGLPDHMYTVYIASTQDNACLMTGVLNTNGEGHGNSHIDMPDLTSGEYYVVIRDGANEAFTTEPVTVR
jgi:hypothetical protein